MAPRWSVLPSSCQYGTALEIERQQAGEDGVFLDRFRSGVVLAVGHPDGTIEPGVGVCPGTVLA